MNSWLRSLLPFGVLLAALLTAWLAHLKAAGQRSDRDRGAYWSRICERVCLFLGLPLLLSMWLTDLLPSQFAHSGLHLEADLTGFGGGAPEAAYPWMLLLPWVVWVLLLALALAERPRAAETGGSLAGALDAGMSRHWLLLCALPPALLVVTSWSRLGGGAGAYPAAAWSSAAVLAVSLTGAALSARPPAGSHPEAKGDGGSPPPLPLSPWPQAMAERGFQLSTVGLLEADPAARTVRGSSAQDLVDRLRTLGARQVAPELVEAIDHLLHPTEEPDHLGPAALVLAPDDCGQHEVVGAAATTLAHRFHETTLVITAEGAAELAARLQRWIVEEGRARTVGSEGGMTDEAWIWVTDTETLSDHLLLRLRDRSLLRRVGLVVWWGLESYSGVVGANLWAISRRLHRLLRHRGRSDVRTLALARSAPHATAQLNAFVRRLLPHPFPDSSRTHVPLRHAREIRVHRITPLVEPLREAGHHSIPEKARHPSLMALHASVGTGWSTGMRLPNDVARTEEHTVLQLPAGGSTVGDALVERRSDAGVWMEKPADGEMLALPEIIACGGRALPPGLPHHTALFLPDNPYARYLLENVGNDLRPRRGASRRLLCAEGHPSILQRHLLLALDEVPDTRIGLLRDFFWEETLIRKTLDRIGFEGRLSRREVRFLDSHGELQRDPFFISSRPAGRQRRPLDTVGTDLLEVRAPAEAQVSDGVRLRLDPERITIRAYPKRIFLVEGKRYRIQEWSSTDEIRARGWLSCRPEDEDRRTLRVRYPYLSHLRPVGPASSISGNGGSLSRLPVELAYEEEVTGILEVYRDPATGREQALPVRLVSPVSARFSTRALLLRPGEPAGDDALRSLGQALSHVLPVHLGITEDSLAVVPVLGETVDELETYGLAIVDLYPGGIGLIDSIQDDAALILDLLLRAREWLEACSCGSDTGCERCLRSVIAQAESPGAAPWRTAALELLGRLVP